MIVWRIVIVFLASVVSYIVANRINDQAVSRMDKYFPKKKGKLGYFFRFYKKGQPVRWLAYWIEWITQIFMLIYIIVLLLGYHITGSWDFITTDFTACWGIFFYCYPLFLEGGVNIYVYFRCVFEKKHEDK